MDKNDQTNWRVVTGTPVEKFDQHAIDPVLARIEALAGLPPFGKAKTGPCALCGSNGKLTYEHLPPRSTHNNKPAAVFGLPKNSMTSVYVTTQQQGSGGHTLCNACNNFTGTEYVRNYQEWVATADHIVLTHHAAIVEHNKSGTGFLNVPALLGPSLHPGKFIRQILCMSASLCGPWLCEEYPIIREIVLSGAQLKLPEPLRIYCTLFMGPTGKHSGGHGMFRQTEGDIVRFAELSHPPFSFVLQLEGAEDPRLGFEISDLTMFDLTEPLGDQWFQFAIAFGHTNFPGDYRTEFEIRNELPL
jgi:hypothetical protein